MRDKKILCLIDGLYMGGAETQMIGLVKLLKEKGYKVDFVKYHLANDYANELAALNIRCITLDVKSKWDKILAIRRFIKEHGVYDCVIAYKDGPAVIGCLLKLIGAKFKLIVSERRVTIAYNRNTRIKFMLYRWADKIVPNSFTQAYLIKQLYPGLRNKLEVITNFTDLHRFSPSNKEFNTTIKILTAARISIDKNILNYLSAIRILKDKGVDVKFEWYGSVSPNEDEYGESVFRRYKELGLEDMIHFYPSSNNIEEKYRDCDIFCLPSSSEGFPNAICEAMACGKPIVASRINDIPNIVQENKNGIFFDPSDVDDMADKLLQIAQKDKSILKKWGQNSREIADSLFSTENFVNHYMQLIEC
jgi:glycosyltransferase involved in cell wall biosynthesis